MSWRLASMRDMNANDPLGGLGERVERAPTPAPAPVRRPDGIVVNPDGKMSTDFPPPSVPEVPVWPFPTQPAQPSAQPAGDVPEPGAHGFMREPLKVGDKIRALPGFWRAQVRGLVEEVVLINHAGPITAHFGAVFSEEGVTWERV